GATCPAGRHLSPLWPVVRSLRSLVVGAEPCLDATLLSAPRCRRPDRGARRQPGVVTSRRPLLARPIHHRDLPPLSIRSPTRRSRRRLRSAAWPTRVAAATIGNLRRSCACDPHQPASVPVAIAARRQIAAVARRSRWLAALCRVAATWLAER